MRLVRALGSVLTWVVVVTGCTSGSDAGEPSSGESVRSSVDTPKLEIPPVADPLDVNAFVADPCALLDNTQREQLGLPAAIGPEQTSSTMCDLFADAGKKDPLNYLSIGVQAGKGLADHYAQCDVVKSIDCSMWTIDDVDSYPVIRANDEHLAKFGNCRLYVGVADDATVVVIDVQAKPGADGPECDRADRAASMALATLR